MGRLQSDKHGDNQQKGGTPLLLLRSMLLYLQVYQVPEGDYAIAPATSLLLRGGEEHCLINVSNRLQTRRRIRLHWQAVSHEIAKQRERE